jgi:hypothetical protein
VGWLAGVGYVDDNLRVRTTTGRQIADSLPELAVLVDALAGHRVILDGELVACPEGKVDFYQLAPRMLHTGRMASWAATQVPVTYVAFDLLHLDGDDLTGLLLAERKQLLDELQLVGPAWIANGWYPDDGDVMFQVCAELGHEASWPSDWTRHTFRVSALGSGSRKNAQRGRVTTPPGDALGYRHKCHSRIYESTEIG